jgi:hypothetical protein
MPDSGLLTDTCIYMQPGSPHFWLSDDIKIIGPDTLGRATPGKKNDVRITVRRKSSECAFPSDTEFIKVDLYVCKPTTSPPTPTSPNVKKILDSVTSPAKEIRVTTPVAGNSVSKDIKWDLPDPSTHPAEEQGHKCLIARAYPNPLTADGSNFHVTDDQHYAQRNICIIPCPPGGEGMKRAKSAEGGGLEVWTENPDAEQALELTLNATADINPDKRVIEILLPLLRQVPGFKRVVNEAPQQFSLTIPDFPDAVVRDNTRIGCLGRVITFLFPPLKKKFQPKYEADIKLNPKQFTNFSFVSDVSKSQKGDAHILHLMQIGSDKRIQGGITLALVVV